MSFGHFVARTRIFAVPIAVALACCFIGWFMWSTAPGQAPQDLANINLQVKGADGIVSKVNMRGDTTMSSDGAATTEVKVFFVCEAAGPLSMELTSMEASGIEYQAPRVASAAGGPPSGTVVSRVAHGIAVAGTCARVQPIDVHITVRFPRNAISAPLQRGTYAFGLELFAANTTGGETPAYSISIQPPKGAVLEEAYDATQRSFKRAVWDGERPFGLTVYGQYTVPHEVAKTLWLNNALLLVLGALVGAGLDATLSFVRGSRQTSSSVGEGMGLSSSQSPPATTQPTDSDGVSGTALIKGRAASGDVSGSLSESDRPARDLPDQPTTTGNPAVD